MFFFERKERKELPVGVGIGFVRGRYACLIQSLGCLKG